MTLDREELYALQEETLMRIALIEIAKDEAQALEEGPEGSAPDPRAIRLIERAIRRMKVRQCVRRKLPRAARIAAAALLFMYLSLTVALVFSACARETFLSLLLGTKTYSSQAGVSPGQVGQSGAPDGWKEKYYPSYIPDGWKLESFDAAFGDVVYRLDKDHIFQFGVYDESANININTSDTTISRVSLNGALIMAAENSQKGFTWVTWSAGGRRIVIYIDSDLDTALDIASGVREVSGSMNNQ